jgi:hypothetical protein
MQPSPVDYIGGGNPQPVESLSGYSSPVDFYVLDITSAHTDFAIRVPKCNYIQTVCDGILDGMSIKLIDQSRQSIPIDKVKTIPSPGINRIYVTNDVRQGRSMLIIMFWQTEPAGLSDQAENITMSELAVRTGSLDEFDRRGEIIYQDDFADTLTAYQIFGNPGYTATQSTSLCEESPISLKLVTNAAASNYIHVRKITPYSNLSKFSVQSNLAVMSLTKGAYEVGVQIYTGAVSISGSIRYNASTQKYQYLSAAGVYTDLATSKLLEESVIGGAFGNEPIFHKIKVVCDMVKREYVRIIVNDDIYDMANIPLVVTADASNKVVVSSVYLVNTDANAITTYLSKIIVKQNEP